MVSIIIHAAQDRNGPNGIILLSSFINDITDIGRAIKAAINIATIDISKPNIKPKTNNNLISPPPKLSFLNITSPKILNKYKTVESVTVLLKKPEAPINADFGYVAVEITKTRGE